MGTIIPILGDSWLRLAAINLHYLSWPRADQKARFRFPHSPAAPTQPFPRSGQLTTAACLARFLPSCQATFAFLIAEGLAADPNAGTLY